MTQPPASTFAERAKARAKAKKDVNDTNPRRGRVTLRAGANAEGTGEVRVTHVQN